jgi:5'-nucleotidase
VEAYSIDGTPSDSVILALGKLARGRVDMVVSGVNHGPNLGEDVHISGTVSAALQGYLRGLPALAVSAPNGDEENLENAARVAAVLARRLGTSPPPGRLFLNVNLPDRPLAEMAGVKTTRLARESHINTVDEGNRGWHKYYWLARERAGGARESDTDIAAVEQGNISVTPLYFNRTDKPPRETVSGLCAGLPEALRPG